MKLDNRTLRKRKPRKEENTMTNAQKKANDAREAFQKEMDTYGLKVEYGSSCRYDADARIVTFSTVAHPAKGQQGLIEELRAAGYEVRKYREEDKEGKKCLTFKAYKTVKIKTEADDAQEYTEKPERPVPFRPEIGKTYDNRGGGRFRCLWSSQPGAAFTGATFINVKSGWKFQAAGIRRYSDGTIEWDCSNGGHFDTEEINPCDCLNCGRQGCVHRGAFRRLPIDEGGMGLCYNLKEG